MNIGNKDILTVHHVHLKIIEFQHYSWLHILGNKIQTLLFDGFYTY